MSSLQDLLTLELNFPPNPLDSSPDPLIGDAAVQGVVSVLSAHAGRFLKDSALRHQIREKCSALTCTKSSGHSVIANLELGIESIERLIEGGRGLNGELNIRSLRNVIRLLSVAANVKLRRKGRSGGFTGGVANENLAACAHLYLSITCKIERKDRASAMHLLQVFIDSPYLARKNLLPKLWNHFFLPHLLHLKVWYAKEVEFISDWDVEFRDQRMKSIDRAYNDQMDVGTSRFALYYKEWIKIGAEAPPVPSVSLPSVAVTRSMYNSVIGLPLEWEDSVDVKLVVKGDAKAEEEDVGISLNNDSGVQPKQPNSIQQQPLVEAVPKPRRSYSLQLISCQSNSNKDPIRPAQIIPKDESPNAAPISSFDRAILLISNSNSLPECEMAIHIVAECWLHSREKSIATLSSSSFIGGLLEISSTSKDDDVLELAISILGELVKRSEVNRQIILSADPQLEILLRLSEKRNLYLKVVVLVYLLKPKAKQMLSSDWIPLVLRVLYFGDKNETIQNLFTVKCCPKSAAMYLLDQLVMGFDVDRNLENARQVVAFGGLGILMKRLEMGNVKEKESSASLLAACVRADGKCRDYLVANIKKVSIIQLFLGNQLKSNGRAISLLSELVCLNRTTHMIEFLNGLKNVGCLNTMHVLLVYLQQAPHEQRPLAAVHLILLDLLGDSSSCSFYKEEGIDAIVAALERSLHNKKLQEQCSRALLLLGSRFSISGEAITEAWLLKRAGMRDVGGKLFRSKGRTRDEFERMEEEEKATENWLRKLATVMLSIGNKRFLVALSNCIADGIPCLARSCLATVAWMSCSLPTLHNDKSSPHALAFSILTRRLLESLTSDKALEERVLASLSLLNFARHRECLQMLFPLSKEAVSSLEDLSQVTWTAEELLFMCSLWSNSPNQAPKVVFDKDAD